MTNITQDEAKEAWPCEKVYEVRQAVSKLNSETLYENSNMADGISVLFLMRMTALRVAVGHLDPNCQLALEAASVLKTVDAERTEATEMLNRLAKGTP